jgi:hypothetical protein
MTLLIDGRLGEDTAELGFASLGWTILALDPDEFLRPYRDWSRRS